MRAFLLALFLLGSASAKAQMGLPLAPACSFVPGGCPTTSISSFTPSPATGTLTTGQSVTITMNFAVPVTVTGTPPTLSLNDGGTATYVSGSGTNALVFTHTVQSGQTANPLAITAINPGAALCVGTCFYVSPTGSDSNLGTSPGAPWQTIAKVNGRTYTAGTSILFQAGGTWTGQLAPPSSGSSGSPITFGSYGSGAQPVISGSGTGTYVLSINTKNYVTITGLSFQNGSQTYGSYIAGGNAVVIQGDTFQNNSGDGLRFDNTTNPIVSGNVFAFNGGSGVEFYNTPNMQVLNNIAHDNVQVDNQFDAGIKADGAADSTVSLADASTGVVITGNLAYNNGIAVGSSDVFTGAGIWIDTIGKGTVISYNLLYNNNDAGINDDHTPDTIITYNVVYNNLFSGIAAYADCGCGIDGYSAMSGTLIYGNTLVGNAYGVTVSGPSAGEAAGGCVNNTVENNIVVNSTTANMRLIAGCENPGTNGSGNVYMYDNLGAAGHALVTWGGTFGGGGTNYTSYSAWENASGNCGSTGCSHSVEAAPTFTNAAAGNYTLLSGDPDIGAGVNLGSAYQGALNPTTTWPSGIAILNQTVPWTVGAFAP